VAAGERPATAVQKRNTAAAVHVKGCDRPRPKLAEAWQRCRARERLLFSLTLLPSLCGRSLPQRGVRARLRRDEPAIIGHARRWRSRSLRAAPTDCGRTSFCDAWRFLGGLHLCGAARLLCGESNGVYTNQRGNGIILPYQVTVEPPGTGILSREDTLAQRAHSRDGSTLPSQAGNRTGVTLDDAAPADSPSAGGQPRHGCEASAKP
jgi:hypothetical protein